MGKLGFWRKLNAEIQFEVGLSFWTIKPVELLNILPFFFCYLWNTFDWVCCFYHRLMHPLFDSVQWELHLESSTNQVIMMCKWSLFKAGGSGVPQCCVVVIIWVPITLLFWMNWTLLMEFWWLELYNVSWIICCWCAVICSCIEESNSVMACLTVNNMPFLGLGWLLKSFLYAGALSFYPDSTIVLHWKI